MQLSDELRGSAVINLISKVLSVHGEYTQMNCIQRLRAISWRAYYGNAIH